MLALYLDSLLVWLGFITEERADDKEAARAYARQIRRILRAPRVDTTPLDVLGSTNDKDKEQ